MWANSRSPWAAWLRFMKSMSMVDHGSSRLAWVCRCSIGLRSWSSPVIHILAGLNVCIQVITPTQLSSALASRMTRRMPAASVRTGKLTMRVGRFGFSSRASAMARAWSAT